MKSPFTAIYILSNYVSRDRVDVVKAHLDVLGLSGVPTHTMFEINGSALENAIYKDHRAQYAARRDISLFRPEIRDMLAQYLAWHDSINRFLDCNEDGFRALFVRDRAELPTDAEAFQKSMEAFPKDDVVCVSWDVNPGAKYSRDGRLGKFVGGAGGTFKKAPGDNDFHVRSDSYSLSENAARRFIAFQDAMSRGEHGFVGVNDMLGDFVRKEFKDSWSLYLGK